jgi:hypothetical protein
MYLVEAPLKGNKITLYDKNGNGLSETVTEEQVLKTVEDGQPWTLTHLYSFPINPDDEEWKSIESAVQRKEMLQLPTELLHNMLTADLVETCLDYFYIYDMYVYDELQSGVEHLRLQFNGVSELFNRNDLAKAMLNKYEVKLNTAEVMPTQEASVQGDFSLRFVVLKMFVAQDEMLNQMTREQLRRLISLTMEANKQITRMPEIFSQIHYEASLFLYSRIILHEGGFEFESEEERQKVEYFARTCTDNIEVLSVFTPDLQNRIYSYLENL